MPEQKIMRDMSLNDPISVEAPVHMWLALTAAYNDCDWSNENLSEVLRRALHQIMDPIFIREQEAAAQHAQDQQAQFFNNITSHLPGMPGYEGPDDDKLE
jgi:hypothetical protein